MQFVLYRLPAGTGVHQVGRGKRIRRRQGVALNRRQPGVFHFHSLLLGGDFAFARALEVTGLFNQSQVVEGHLIVRILLDGLLQFGLGLVHSVHFVEHFSVLHEGSSVDLLFLHLRQQGLHLPARHPALQRFQGFVIFLFEPERGLVFWVNRQHTFDVQIGLPKTSALLRLLGQRQSHGGQTGNGFLGFRVDAHADGLHGFISPFVSLGSAHQISLAERSFRFGQPLP